MRNSGQKRKPLRSLQRSATQAPQDFQKITEAMIALRAVGNQQRTTGTAAIVADTDTAMYKKYGLCSMDMDRMLIMCGLKAGQEDRLPQWIKTVAMTNLSKDGKRTAVRAALLADPKYDEHPIPITPQLLKMIMDKEFTGDDNNTMAGGSMKGLSIYIMESMTPEEIEEAAEYAQALEEPRSATVGEIRKRNARKAQAPAAFSSLLDSLKTYANLLLALFGRKCPFLQELVRDMIMPLQKFLQHAKTLMLSTTLAAIMWAAFKQGCSFALDRQSNGFQPIGGPTLD